MALKVERWDAGKQGPLSARSMCQHLQRQGYATATYTFPAGTNFPEHSHAVDKKDAIVAGQFYFRMGGEEVVLRPGDMLEVPRGRPHEARCVGDAAVVFVDASKL